MKMLKSTVMEKVSLLQKSKRDRGGRESRLCQREINSHLSRSTDREVGQSQDEQDPHLGER